MSPSRQTRIAVAFLLTTLTRTLACCSARESNAARPSFPPPSCFLLPRHTFALPHSFRVLAGNMSDEYNHDDEHGYDEQG